jgi:hypothetical protein
MPSKLLLCLMLCCVGLPVAARDVPQMPASGGSCAVSQEESTDGESVRGTADKRAGQTPAASRTSTTRRGGDGEAAARPPRWHSFLPGMFR